MGNELLVSRAKPLVVEAAGDEMFDVIFLCSAHGCSDVRRATLARGRVEILCRCGHVNQLKVCLGGFTVLELGDGKVFSAQPADEDSWTAAADAVCASCGVGGGGVRWCDDNGPNGGFACVKCQPTRYGAARAQQRASAAHDVRIQVGCGEGVDDAKVKQVVASGFTGLGPAAGGTGVAREVVDIYKGDDGVWLNLSRDWRRDGVRFNPSPVSPPASKHEATLDELVAMLREDSSLRAEIENLRHDRDTAWELVSVRNKQIDDLERIAGMSEDVALLKLRECVSDRAGLAFALFAVAMEGEAKRRADNHPIPWVLARMMADPAYATQFKAALDQASAIMKQTALHGSDGIRAYFEAARAKVTAMAAAERAKAVQP